MSEERFKANTTTWNELEDCWVSVPTRHGEIAPHFVVGVDAGGVWLVSKAELKAKGEDSVEAEFRPYGELTGVRVRAKRPSGDWYVG